jgi:hypothetical protein
MTKTERLNVAMGWKKPTKAEQAQIDREIKAEARRGRKSMRALKAQANVFRWPDASAAPCAEAAS